MISIEYVLILFINCSIELVSKLNNNNTNCIDFRRKSAESQKKDVSVYKIQNLNHTDHAYHEAVNRLKVRD